MDAAVSSLLVPRGLNRLDARSAGELLRRALERTRVLGQAARVQFADRRDDSLDHPLGMTPRRGSLEDRWHSSAETGHCPDACFSGGNA
jgi:hypothetical protein